jgi:hypothetical protein
MSATRASQGASNVILEVKSPLLAACRIAAERETVRATSVSSATTMLAAARKDSSEVASVTMPVKVLSEIGSRVDRISEQYLKVRSDICLGVSDCLLREARPTRTAALPR